MTLALGGLVQTPPALHAASAQDAQLARLHVSVIGSGPSGYSMRLGRKLLVHPSGASIVGDECTRDSPDGRDVLVEDLLPGDYERVVTGSCSVARHVRLLRSLTEVEIDMRAERTARGRLDVVALTPATSDIGRVRIELSREPEGAVEATQEGVPDQVLSFDAVPYGDLWVRAIDARSAVDGGPIPPIRLGGFRRVTVDRSLVKAEVPLDELRTLSVSVRTLPPGLQAWGTMCIDNAPRRWCSGTFHLLDGGPGSRVVSRLSDADGGNRLVQTGSTLRVTGLRGRGLDLRVDAAGFATCRRSVGAGDGDTMEVVLEARRGSYFERADRHDTTALFTRPARGERWQLAAAWDGSVSACGPPTEVALPDRVFIDAGTCDVLVTSARAGPRVILAHTVSGEHVTYPVAVGEQPCASIDGRLATRSATPIPGAALYCLVVTPEGLVELPCQRTVSSPGEEPGRFRISGLGVGEYVVAMSEGGDVRVAQVRVHESDLGGNPLRVRAVWSGDE